MNNFDNSLNNEDSVYVNDDTNYNKNINTIPNPPLEIGLDTQNKFYSNILNAAEVSKLDISKFESFTQVSQDRDTIYSLLDTMAEDPIISAILETYAEDATESNDSGRIIWVESSDDNIAKFVDFLLQSMNVDKHIYKWTYSLCKYGDLYLRLYRESEFKDDLFLNVSNNENLDTERKNLNEDIDNKEQLNEDVKFNAFSPKDNYQHYIEMHQNPAEIFELTKFGKSYAYIKAPVNISNKVNNLNNTYLKYSFKKKDVEVYDATTFVHAALEDNSNRTSETVDIFLDNSDESQNNLSYTVKRGQSLLYNSYKIWRELNLLENSLLLNRLTKSSIVRILNVEVGDMPKEQVGPHLLGIKNLIEQKTANNQNNNINEYTSPGPIENNIYVPTHNGQGAISTQEVGGELNVTGLGDIDYFKNKFFGSLRVPKQYFGETDDSTGFNGGTSLSIVSSRYAKMIKRIQNSMIQVITDVINILLLDKGLESYVNKYELHMQPPTTQEELDRRDNMSNKVGIANDIMNLLGEVEDASAKLKILKSLLSNIVNDNEIISIIQEQIDNLENIEDSGIDTTENSDLDNDLLMSDHSTPDINIDNNIPSDSSNDIANNDGDLETSGSQILPTPAQLGAGDFSDSNNPSLT